MIFRFLFFFFELHCEPNQVHACDCDLALFYTVLNISCRCMCRSLLLYSRSSKLISEVFPSRCFPEPPKGLYNCYIIVTWDQTPLLLSNKSSYSQKDYNYDNVLMYRTLYVMISSQFK